MSSPLMSGHFVVNRRKKKNKRSKVRFILDESYCKQCPDRIYQCLREAEKLLDIQIYNGIKCNIIEYAAGKKRKHKRRIRCHTGGCVHGYQHKHRYCKTMMKRNSFKYKGRNRQQAHSHLDDFGYISEDAATDWKVKKWGLRYELKQGKKWKHQVFDRMASESLKTIKY